MKTRAELSETETMRVCMWLAVKLGRDNANKLAGRGTYRRILQRQIGECEGIRQNTVSRIGQIHAERIEELSLIPEDTIRAMIYATAATNPPRARCVRGWGILRPPTPLYFGRQSAAGASQ